MYKVRYPRSVNTGVVQYDEHVITHQTDIKELGVVASRHLWLGQNVALKHMAVPAGGSSLI